MIVLPIREQPVLLLCPSLVGAGVERRVYLLFNQLSTSWSRLKLGLLREEGEFLGHIDQARRLYIKPPPLIRFVCLPLKPCIELYHFLVAIYQIRAMLDNYKPVAVITFTLETTLPMFVARFLYANNKLIWIISEDSNTAVAAGNASKSRLINKLLQKLFGYVYRKADFVTTVSSSVQLAVQQIYALQSEYTNVIHNPIDYTGIQPLSNTIQPLNFDYILAVGRLVKVKQFDLLIRAFSQLKNPGSIQLVILGEGPERIHLQQLSTQLEIAHAINFPGFVDNPWVYMKHAKMLVLTSQLEGFGNVIVEAMAVGCPVIATNCGGPSDIIKHSINGLTVTQNCESIAQAIERLLDNPDFSNSLSTQAEIDVKQFNAERSCKQFNDMLLQQLSNQSTCKVSNLHKIT